MTSASGSAGRREGEGADGTGKTSAEPAGRILCTGGTERRAARRLTTAATRNNAVTTLATTVNRTLPEFTPPRLLASRSTSTSTGGNAHGLLPCLDQAALTRPFAQLASRQPSHQGQRCLMHVRGHTPSLDDRDDGSDELRSHLLVQPRISVRRKFTNFRPANHHGGCCLVTSVDQVNPQNALACCVLHSGSMRTSRSLAP